MTRRKSPTRKAVLDAIPNTGGVVQRIAEKLGYSWHATHAAIQADPVIMAAYQDECERVNDIAEHNIIKAIAEGDRDESRWWLKTRRRAKFGDAVDVTSGGDKIQAVQFVEIVRPPNDGTLPD